jgi:hypothetical protein
MTKETPINNDAPEFTPEKWNNDFFRADLWGSNCLQYAMAGSLPDGTNRLFNEIPPDPGETVGYKINKQNITKNDVLEALKVDSIQVIKETDKLPTKKNGNYIVGIYVSDLGTDYHFVRQDRDGGWSHKSGIGAKIERFIEPTDNGDYATPPQTYYDYRLIGYAYAPKEGRDLGPEKKLMEEIKQCKSIDYAFTEKGKASYKLYDTMIDKYGQELVKCGVDGGKEVTINDYMECNYSNYSAINLTNSENCQKTRGKQSLHRN